MILHESHELLSCMVCMNEWLFEIAWEIVLHDLHEWMYLFYESYWIELMHVLVND